jgi:C-terminal processing protease CtpA/Prc
MQARYWMLLACVPVVARAQDVGNFDRERGRIMLRQVRKEIEGSYYDSTLKGVDLAGRATALEARIQQATSIAEILASIAQLALELNDSHTFFVPPQQTVRVNYGWEMFMVGESCFVARVEPKSDAARQGVTAGDLVLTVNGYAPTRENLWKLLYLYHVLRPQSALHVVLQSPTGLRRELDLAADVRESKRILDLTGHNDEDIASIIREAQNAERDMRSLLIERADVLVWKLPTFGVDDGTIREAVKRARDHRALILDLRGDAGGPERALLALVGRLSREPVAIGTLHERRRTMPLAAKGAGPDAFTGQLVVLVDSRSASASEVLARALQLSGRGTVLGDRTAGAVMRGRYHSLSLGTQTAVFYGVNVTEADLAMGDGGRLEGVGVRPDSVILPSAADLAADRDPVLAHAFGLAGRPLDPAAAGALLRRP